MFDRTARSMSCSPRTTFVSNACATAPPAVVAPVNWRTMYKRSAVGGPNVFESAAASSWAYGGEPDRARGAEREPGASRGARDREPREPAEVSPGVAVRCATESRRRAPVSTIRDRRRARRHGERNVGCVRSRESVGGRSRGDVAASAGDIERESPEHHGRPRRRGTAVSRVQSISSARAPRWGVIAERGDIAERLPSSQFR